MADHCREELSILNCAVEFDSTVAFTALKLASVATELAIFTGGSISKGNAC